MKKGLRKYYILLHLIVITGFTANIHCKPNSADIKVVQDTSSHVTLWEDNVKVWSKNRSLFTVLRLSKINSEQYGGKTGLKMDFSFAKCKAPFWAFSEQKFTVPRDWSRFDGISIESIPIRTSRCIAGFSVMLFEKEGAAYIAQDIKDVRENKVTRTDIPWTRFHLAGDWTKDDNGKLDPDKIIKIAIGIFSPIQCAESLSVNVYHMGPSHFNTDSSLAKKSFSVKQKSDIPLQKFEPDSQGYFGAFAFSAPIKNWGKKRSDWERQWDPKQVADFEKDAGDSVGISAFFWFLDWKFPVDICTNIAKIQKSVLLSVLIGMPLRDIAEGKADTQIQEWAEAAKKIDAPMFIRFLPEMNGNWHKYSESVDSSSTCSRYIEAWKKVVTIFRKHDVKNVAWVWSPTAYDAGFRKWKDYYPGDAYVDWVGVSVYSFLGNGDPRPQIMGVYNDYADRKPIMIAECGSGDADNNFNTYKPGTTYWDNPQLWIERFFATLNAEAPRVKAIIWFNIMRERDWRIQESAIKKETFSSLIRKSRFRGHVKP